jgi:hypothetical protein
MTVTTREPARTRGRRDISIGEAARAFGVMSGGAAVLAGAVAWSVASTARAVRHRRRPPVAALAGVGALALYATVVIPWTRRWGATQDETTAPLPGDELVLHPGIEMTRAITIAAPIDEVWAWLAQIGQDRGGFYSYEWLENLAGCELRNADRIHEEWQERAVGEQVPLHPLSGVTLGRFEPPEHYVLEGWSFHLSAIDDRTTRLLARTRVPRGPASAVYGTFVELPHFIMERKMMLGIKERAERGARRTASRSAHSHEPT